MKQITKRDAEIQVKEGRNKLRTEKEKKISKLVYRLKLKIRIVDFCIIKIKIKIILMCIGRMVVMI